MKFLLPALFFIASTHARAQYYYKDILGTQETSRLLKLYKDNKISKVSISSYESGGIANDDVSVTQIFDPLKVKLTTITSGALSAGSTLVSVADADGRLVANYDSSSVIMSRTDYQYNAASQLTRVSYQSTDTMKSLKTSDVHYWEWKDSKPFRMTRIKGYRDTTFVDFKTDDRGNVTEEVETHRGIKSLPLYYYYNSSNQLTDIVRYSERAGKLLPENLFEYTTEGRLKQMITVPDNSSNYTIWVYQYNEKGLKVKEAIYEKQNKTTPIGRIQYVYESKG